MSHSRDTLLRDNILTGYTITEISCDECKLGINVTSSDLLLLWMAIRNHENTAPHKFAVAQNKNECVESKVLSSQLSSPLEHNSDSLGKKNTNTDFMNVVSRDLISPIESKQSLISNDTVRTLHFEKSSTHILDKDSESDYPPADCNIHGKVRETTFVCDSNSIQLEDDKSDQMLIPMNDEERVMKNTWCEVCLVTYPTRQTDHVKGKKHLKLLKNQPKMEDVPRLPVFLQPKSSRIAENGPWCDTCSIWLPAGDSESVSLHNEGRKHKCMINMKKDYTSKRDEFVKCIICNVSVPKLYLRSHLYGKKHQTLLEEKEAESITVTESLQPITEWCHFCKILIPSCNKAEHNKDGTHRSMKRNLYALKKGHVFEYYEKHPGVPEDSFICVLCSAFQGRTRVKERNALSHCSKKLHASLIEAKVFSRTEPINDEAHWACMLCWNFIPMSTSLTDHVESLNHRDAVEKCQHSISESNRLMTSVQEPDQNVESKVCSKKQKETCNIEANAEQEKLLRMLKNDGENSIEITEEVIFVPDSSAGEDVGNETPGSSVAGSPAASSAQRWFCSFCFTISMGQEARDRHCNSLSHLSKVKTLEKIARPEEKTPTTSASQVKRSETNGTSLDRVHMPKHPTEPLISGDVWNCLICSITSTDKKALISHGTTSLHIKKLLAFSNLDLLRDDNIPLLKRASLMRKLIREAEGITHHVKLWPKLVVTETDDIFCEICNKTVASPYDAVIHALWENHQQRVALLRSDWLDSQWLTETSKNRFHCELCEGYVQSYSRQLVDACKHASDDVHCKLLDMSYSEAVTKVLDQMKISEGDHFDSGHLTDCGDLLYCNVCDDFLNTPRDAFKHVQTQAHLQLVAAGCS